MKRAAVIDIRRQAPQTWQDGMTRFLSWRKSQGAAERTLSGYKENIILFFKRFPTAWSPACRECLMEHLSQEGISPSTYNVRLKVLRPFFEFCVNEGVFSSSPAEGLKYRRESPRIVDHAMEDIKKILDAIGAETFATLRDSTLLLLQLDTGVRPSEALQLRPSDVDLHTRRAFIRPATSKTRQGRTIFFSESTWSMLKRLVEVRPEEWSNDLPLFCTGYGEPWNTHSWTVQLRRYAEKAGLKRFSAYDLRHQHALEALRNGMNVFELQKGMGHSTLSMTEKYLALSLDDLRKAHEKASPVKALFPEKKKRVGKI